MSTFRIGVDIGGTFTDLVASDKETGVLTNIKVPSTPVRLADGVISAFSRFLESTEPAEIELIMHASTIATNAILGQTGLELPKAALITTKGFRDVLAIGRQRRPELYNLFGRKPRALVARRHRYEIEERMNPKGEEVHPVNLQDLQKIAADIKREGVDSVAIGLLNSYANPGHEKQVKEILEKALPNTPITSSHEVSSEYREYERISTVVVNALLMPIVSQYIHDLVDEMTELGVSAPFYVMKSNGGIASGDVILSSPVTMIESGPAAGVVASAFHGELLGIENVLSFDMGGTTAKAGLVKSGKPEIVTECEVGGKTHRGRITKGSGYPVRVPFVDLAECSAGGGTIAWIDEGEGLRVGPLSAGASPGPACYGLGGEEPTITDANLILGRLNPAHLLGGKMRVHKELAGKAIGEKICTKIGLALTEAAMGIVKIANSEMGKILRMVSVERGHDPRQFTLIAFGGAGPIHCCALAEDLGISSIVVPVNPGLFSAAGLLAADLKHDLLRAVVKDVTEIDSQAVEKTFQDLETEGRTILEKEKVEAENMTFIREFDARYNGQAYELTIPAARPFAATELEKTIDEFHERHREVYGYAAPEETVELVNARLTVIGLVTKPKWQEAPLASEKPAEETISARRDCFFEDHDQWLKTPVYVRENLRPGNRIRGPAIVEQYDATTVIYPAWEAAVDRFGNICMERR